MSIPNAAQLSADGATKFLILDFDGVVNTFFSDEELQDGDLDIFYLPTLETVERCIPLHGTEEKDYLIRYSDDLIYDLNEILADPVVQLVWLSTWRDRLLDVGPKLGLTSARTPVAMTPHFKMADYSGYHGKTVALENFMNGYTPQPGDKWAWSDDVVVPSYVWHKSQGFEDIEDDLFRLVGTANHVLLPAHQRFGLRRSEVAQVRNLFKTRTTDED